MKFFKKVISTPITRKEYHYKLGDVQLSFTLRQDTKEELLAFKKLLDSAIIDVNLDLK